MANGLFRTHEVKEVTVFSLFSHLWTIPCLFIPL